MEQAESNLDSLRVFTTEKWFVQLGMAARGIACCSKCGTSGRIVIQVPAFKLPACSRVTAHSETMGLVVLGPSLPPGPRPDPESLSETPPSDSTRLNA